MHLKKVTTGFFYSLKELIRSRITLVLFLVIPVSFYLLAYLTTKQDRIPFKLASLSEKTILRVPARHEVVVFMSLTAVGLLASFVALNLLQKNRQTQHRLMLCGYSAAEILLSRLATCFCVFIFTAVYASLIMLLFFRPAHYLTMLAGLVMQGFVYGAFGLLTGTLFRQELEGILVIVMLTNIDVAWLQNPVFYANAQNTVIIRSLPAFFPSQFCMIGAFSDKLVFTPFLGSLLYGSGLLFLAILIYRFRMRIYPVAGNTTAHTGNLPVHMQKYYFDILTPAGEYLFFYMAYIRIAFIRMAKIQFNLCAEGKADTVNYTLHRRQDSFPAGSSNMPFLNTGITGFNSRTASFRFYKNDLEIDLQYTHACIYDFTNNPFTLSPGKGRFISWQPVSLKSKVSGYIIFRGKRISIEQANGYIDYLSANAGMLRPLIRNLYWCRIHTDECDITYSCCDSIRHNNAYAKVIVRLRESLLEFDACRINILQWAYCSSLDLDYPHIYRLECSEGQRDISITITHTHPALVSDFIGEMKIKNRILQWIIGKLARNPRTCKFISGADIRIRNGDLTFEKQAVACIDEYVSFLR